MVRYKTKKTRLRNPKIMQKIDNKFIRQKPPSLIPNCRQNNCICVCVCYRISIKIGTYKREAKYIWIAREQNTNPLVSKLWPRPVLERSKILEYQISKRIAALCKTTNDWIIQYRFNHFVNIFYCIVTSYSLVCIEWSFCKTVQNVTENLTYFLAASC